MKWAKKKNKEDFFSCKHLRTFYFFVAMCVACNLLSFGLWFLLNGLNLIISKIPKHLSYFFCQKKIIARKFTCISFKNHCPSKKKKKKKTSLSSKKKEKTPTVTIMSFFPPPSSLISSYRHHHVFFLLVYSEWEREEKKYISLHNFCSTISSLLIFSFQLATLPSS